MSDTPGIDLVELLWEAQGYLGLNEILDSVPRDELLAQAKAHGYTEREFTEALRETDEIEAVDDPLASNPDLRLATGNDHDDHDETDDAASGDTPEPTVEESTAEDAPPEERPYDDVEWSTIDHGTDPAGVDDYDAWMPAQDKKPWNPGATTENKRAWSNPENWTTADKTHEWFDLHPQITGRAFILQGDAAEENYNGNPDPFLFVDYDDAADGEGTEPSEAAQELMNRLGFTYTDYSTSGTGNHQIFRGELPDNVRTIQFELDDGGEVEIYDQRRVVIMTGKHVAGTPVDPQPVNEDALADLADKHGKTQSTVDRDDWNPEFEREDLAGMDTTDNIQAIFDALRHVEPRDIRLRSDLTEERPDGTLSFDPTWANSKSGKRLGWDPDIGFIYRKGDVGLDALQVVALEEGIIRSVTDYPTGEDWWTAVDALRDRGARIPEYERCPGGSENVAVLPHEDHLQQASSGWDWRHAAEQKEATLTVDDARERTVGTIAHAYETGDRVLVEALPTMGKSYGSIKAAADTAEQITVLTGRGHKEQYAQFQDWCDEHGLSYYTLPSFTRDCDTANGEHGEEWADTVRGWYNRGATPKEIHKSAEYVLGRPLPCQEHEGAQCPYASKWDFEPDEYDVLIGHYSHAHKPKVTAGRTVVFDEFPNAYETILGPELQGAVSYWLKATEGVPFDSYTDLLENRNDQSRRADALLWFDEHGVEPDETHVFDDQKAHAAAPLAVFTLLASDNLGNGVERAELEDIGTGQFNRAHGWISVLRPPALEYASGVVALDGTPTKRMWELSLGERLNHRSVLQGDERVEYVRDALNLNLVRTTEHVKPYNSAGHINTKRDAALLEAIAEKHGERPAVITTTTAEREYDSDGVSEFVDETKHYGNVLGSNEFNDTRLGAVIGSNHYGDDFIKKWGAYAGEAVERGNGRGADLSYGEFGDQVLTHMREHDTLQAAMRFGRDGNGAVVYVHTDTLPEWVPLAGEGRVVKTWSDGMRQVIRALEDLGEATTAALVDHPAVDLSRQQVFDHLENLRERGVLTREQDTEDGRRVVWRDDGVHRLGDHGEVELEPVELDDLGDAEVRQLARSSLYTWEFTNTSGEGGGSSDPSPPEAPGRDRPVTNGGDRPPNQVD